MRLSKFRRPLLPLCVAFTFSAAACGDDASPGPDTSDTQSDTNDTAQPDTDTAQPDTDATQPDTDATQPDTDATQPDTDDTTQPDTDDTTQPDTDDTTQPDTDDTAQPDTDDTAQPDTDTTPTTATLAELLTPFASSANNFETAPNAKVTGLVVTLVKPDVGTELGGFFVQDPADQKAIYFAPATGVIALPEELEETSIIEVTIGKIKNVSGMPMVTEYSDLTITGVVDNLDEAFQDATAWEVADWAGKQSTYIDMVGLIVGNPELAGGGANGYRRFGFISDGIETPTADVNIRFPVEVVNYFAIEDGCGFDLIAGAVWAFRADTAGAPIQYQPMFFSPWSFALLLCTPPVLSNAVSTNSTTAVLTFSRPMYPDSMDPASFTFEPPLEVLAADFSDDLKTVTLTTAEQTEPGYTVTVDEEAFDTTYELINPDERSFTFVTGTVQPTLAVLYCFETDATTYSGTPTLVGSGFADVTDVTRVGGTINATIAGNGSKPAECTVTGNARSAQGPATWSAETAFSPSLASYYTFSFKAPAGRVSLKFDAHRSNTGPSKLAVWESASSTTVATDVDVPTAFSAYPMFPVSGTEYAFDIPDSTGTAVEVRIYPYASGSGTFRIDNLTVLFTPAE